jgi:alpha-N-arabinofuranosidase
VKATRKSDRTIDISFDEWNVWYQSRVPGDLAKDTDDWPLAPRLSEEPYTVADGVVVGNLLMSLLRHADRVTSASIAQVVNVIAPIGAEPGGPAWRKSSFFPFAATSRLARGVALQVGIDSPWYDTTKHGQARLVDAAASLDQDAGTAALFLVNRSQDEEVRVSVELTAIGLSTVAEALTLSDADAHAANTAEERDRVGLKPNGSAKIADGVLTLTLPPVSWTALSLA